MDNYDEEQCNNWIKETICLLPFQELNRLASNGSALELEYVDGSYAELVPAVCDEDPAYPGYGSSDSLSISLASDPSSDTRFSFDACDQPGADPPLLAFTSVGAEVDLRSGDQPGADPPLLAFTSVGAEVGLQSGIVDVSSPKRKTSRKPRSRQGGARPTATRASKRLLSLGRKPAASTPVRECDLSRDKKRAYPCGECRKEFRDRESLTRHTRKHRGHVKICKECDRKLGPQKNNLTRHMRAVHGMNRKGEPLTQEELDEHLCDFEGCTKRFSRDDKLRIHIEKNHPHTKKFFCEMTRHKVKPTPCKFFCFTEKKMDKHKLKNHRKYENFEDSSVEYEVLKGLPASQGSEDGSEDFDLDLGDFDNGSEDFDLDSRDFDTCSKVLDLEEDEE